MTTSPDHPSQRMQCMEVWGGNQIVNSGVVMSGLDAWVYSKPFGESEGGGDVYYVSSCATGRISRLLVADVSGHGSAVCDIAGQLRSLMRQYVNFLDQTRFVNSMNRQFTELSEAGCFATAVVTTFFASTGSLSLCNAGHPPPLVYRAKTREWSFLEEREGEGERSASNIPLGILDLDDYEQFDVRLQVADLVLCYTDSLIESRGRDGEMLGRAGFLELVQKLDVSDSTQVIPKLLELVETQWPKNLTEDDVTVLLFRPNGLSPRAPFWERAIAPIRLIGKILRPNGQPIPWPEISLVNVGGALFEPISRWNRGRKRMKAKLAKGNVSAPA